MTTKIYIGSNENVIIPITKQTVRYTIEFYDNPTVSTFFNVNLLNDSNIVMNFYKQFRTSDNTIYYSLREATTEATIVSLLDNLLEFNTNENITYSLSDDNNTYGYKDIWVDVVGLESDVFTLFISSNITSINFITPYQLNTFSATQSSIQSRFDEFDLYKDETINLTSKLSDIEKLSNIFTDFTNTFTIPATDNNNQLFKHYYDVDIYNTFNANIRVLGYLEIDTFPLRYGKIQLEQCILKQGRPESYKITFYGGLLQISDLFGDDTIDKLDYKKDTSTGLTETTPTWNSLSKFDYAYEGGNFINSINLPSFLDGNIITPLISYTNRDWNYGSNNIIDIATDSGSIIDSELRPAIRIMRIIEAIEVKYDIKFTRNFFSSSVFNNLFMWMNARTTSILGTKTDVIISTPLSGSPDAGNITEFDNYITIARQRYSRFAAVEYIARIDYEILPTVPSIKYNAYLIDENGIEVKKWENLSGDNTLSKEWKSEYSMNGNENIIITEVVKLVLEPEQTLEFVANIHTTYKRKAASVTTIYTDLYSNTNTNTIFVSIFIKDNIPKMKVIDFFQGIMKMFKLIIRPESSNIFYVNTLDGYYSDGNILDITDYTDVKSVTVERPIIYKTITFNYQKTNNIAGKKFREINDDVNDLIGYGDLRSIQPYVETKEELKVELPFENMMFERMTVQLPNLLAGSETNISIGQSIQSSDDGITFSENNSKPILFFNNGLANNTDYPFKVKFGDTIIPVVYNYIIGNTDDALTSQITNSINWGTEIDPWHNIVVYNSLFLNYWKNWINTIYSLKQRKFTYTAYLPPRYAEELSLNDRIIIGSNRYKINDYTINLTNGETKFTLIVDIYEPYSITESLFNGYQFSSGLYITDFTDSNSSGSYFLYGSFTTYNGLTASKVIKMRKDGKQDMSFNTTLGGPNSVPFAGMRLHRFDNDSLLVAGYYSSYNGVSGYGIRKLHPNGTIDTSLTPGTFGVASGQRYTEKIEVQSDNKILLSGLFSSYDGNPSRCLVRISSTGSYDTSFDVGSVGFSGTVIDVIQNSDETIYASGYFTSYKGTTANGIIKLTSTASIDTSFILGTGFTPNGSSSVNILLSSDDNLNSVYVAGTTLTHYKGATMGRVVKLDSIGDIDTSFDIGIGVTAGSVNTIRYTENNEKIFIAGSFSSFNGQTTNRAVIVNIDGSIYQTFPQSNYNNLYNIGNDVYGTDKVSYVLSKLTSDLQLNIYTFFIQSNAAPKYYSIDITSNSTWSITPMDLGWGNDWVDILTPNGTGNSEIQIYIKDKTLQPSPDIYLERRMALKIISGNIEKWVTIRQAGL